MEALSRTDPSARNDVQEGQLLIHGLGALHLEIVEGRLRDEWKVNFEFGRRYVSYRESLGPNNPTENWNVWETEIGGKSVKITMSITIRPLEPEDPIASFNSKHYADGEPKRSVNGNRKRGQGAAGEGKIVGAHKQGEAQRLHCRLAGPRSRRTSRLGTCPAWLGPEGTRSVSAYGGRVDLRSGRPYASCSSS